MQTETRHHPKRRLFIIFLWLVLFAIGWIFTLDFSKPKEQLTFGATFSHKYARDVLRLDWRQAFIALLGDLNIRHLRLMTYWDEMEPREGEFNFEPIDWLINEARARGADVILVVGQRQPRWPECHIPQWAKELPAQAKNKALLNYIEKVVQRYRFEPSLKYWQVENEPLLSFFGKCPPIVRTFLGTEIDTVKKLDQNHPVLITASGEFDNWRDVAQFADVVGVSLYRVIAKKFIGNIHYPLPAAFYRSRAALNPKQTGLFVVELQAEPWTVRSITETPHDEYKKQMNAQILREHIEFAIATGFNTFYLWGAEWWYWLKEERDKPEMWDEAKKIFKTAG